MLHSDEQYLQFYCGPFALMLPLNSMAEIAFFNETFCAPSGDSLLHHGQSTTWRSATLPYIDLRLALQLPRAQLHPPSNMLVLRDAVHHQAIAMLAVDEVTGFVTPQADEWYLASGINPNLDDFVDRFYANKHHSALVMCLRDPSQWLTKALTNTQITSANPAHGIHHAH
jgi:chemotaxis signal transduction protein